MSKSTSDRHTGILNGYQSMDSKFYDWAKAKLGDIRITDWSYGRVSMEWRIGDRMVMPDGFMFGGHVASAADHFVGLVSMSALEHDNERFRTSRLETNYFRPVMQPTVTIEARATNVSKTLIHAEADVLNAEGKLAVRIYAVQVRRTMPD